ncbi:type 4a pilus biogenesis protein PilO [Egicoccus halophilus]|uniref:Pilus assembly protein PilO n=1 Tax=Egicoccus halophilus TaxID=1670830 RepID=A0A8J3EY84_9ACTN|nr:type 4a pilus biogenesis protein PilO [Egicoccus halophilus]GGI07365.1 hypothetical protein GCM10011354_23720 [Egicoccus halophilus]
MTRTQMVLMGLVGVLMIALYVVLLHQPRAAEIAQIRSDTVTAQDDQARLQAEIARLQQVRSRAPELEGELTAARAVVPDAAALPALVRQLETAADDAGVAVGTMTLGKPATEAPAAMVARLPVSLSVSGSFFQLVDYLRRLEDPTLTPRGLRWDAVSVTTAEYPELTATLTGRAFVDAAAVTPLDAAAAGATAPASPESTAGASQPDGDPGSAPVPDGGGTEVPVPGETGAGVSVEAAS